MHRCHPGLEGLHIEGLWRATVLAFDQRAAQRVDLRSALLLTANQVADVLTVSAVKGRNGPCAYFAVGITNSAPLPMLSGQRCMMDFCLV